MKIKTIAALAIMFSAASASAQDPALLEPPVDEAASAPDETQKVAAAAATDAAILSLVEASLETETPDTAISVLKRALEDRDSPPVRERLVELLLDTGACSEARRQFEQLQATRVDEASVAGCFGAVRVECEGKPDVRVAGQKLACGEQRELDPGDYAVEGAEVERVIVVGGQVASLTARTEPDAQPEPRASAVPPVKTPVADRAETISLDEGTERRKLAVDLGDGARFAAVQVAGFVPMGGFTLQEDSGFADAGFGLGGGVEVLGAWGFSRLIAAEGRIGLDYFRAKGLGAKHLNDEAHQALGKSQWRFVGEPRVWVSIIGFGLFAEHRRQAVLFGPEPQTAAFWLGGPTIAISTKGAERTRGYFDIFVRWAPVFDGSATTLSGGFEAATGLLVLGVRYDTYQLAPGLAVRRGEDLMFNAGLRLPFALIDESEDS